MSRVSRSPAAGGATSARMARRYSLVKEAERGPGAGGWLGYYSRVYSTAQDANLCAFEGVPDLSPGWSNAQPRVENLTAAEITRRMGWARRSIHAQSTQIYRLRRISGRKALKSWWARNRAEKIRGVAAA